MQEGRPTLAQLEVLHAAFGRAFANARRRELQILFSPAALQSRAENLRAVRDAILTTMSDVNRGEYSPA